MKSRDTSFIHILDAQCDLRTLDALSRMRIAICAPSGLLVRSVYKMADARCLL